MPNITPFQLTDNFTMENFNSRIEAINALTYSDVDAAPAGYGLGSASWTTIADCNQADRCGWWVTQIETANAPDDPAISGRTLVGFIHTSTRGTTTNRHQTFYAVADSLGFSKYYKLERWCKNGAWEEWEFVDPPMELGAEYRTTERYLGKPVYVKVVNVGAFPTSGEAEVPWNAGNALNVEQLVRTHGNIAAVYSLPLQIGSDALDYSATRNVVYLRTTGTRYTGEGAVITFYYTKTTD